MIIYAQIANRDPVGPRLLWEEGMARPRIFISSSFYDLKHVRSSLETFISTLGYEPVLSEKGDVAYSPEIGLDESCYREAQTCDVFVLIVGGRYGSKAGGSSAPTDKSFYENYESITRKEYQSAVARDIPTYILIDKSVYAEYETFAKNRDNTTIKYAHVDSVNVFSFIDYILSRPRNNPVYHFDESTEIEVWLRNQWAGLFRELIRTRSEQKQLSSLADQVADLTNTGTTLKRYLEELVRQSASQEEAKEIIEQEQTRLSETRELNELAKLEAIQSIVDRGVPIETARDAFASATTLEDLANRVSSLSSGQLNAAAIIRYWKSRPDRVSQMNEVRKTLRLPPLTFADTDKERANHGIGPVQAGGENENNEVPQGGKKI